MVVEYEHHAIGATMEGDCMEHGNHDVVLMELLDANTKLASIGDSNQGSVGALEQQLMSLSDNAASVRQVAPIAAYVSVLRDIRALSAQTSAYRQEMGVAVALKERLAALAEDLGLPDDHYDIDTTGDPIVLKEGMGEHVLLPTHFEKGAYLSNPHADHQMLLKASQLPRIKIGRYVRFGAGVGVNAGGDLDIGNYVWFSPAAYILKQNHDAYGRPSVGSRTVAMTEMPKVRFADYAWVGKEAVIGWAADYVGKAAVVASRSFVNTWVGDYAITGNSNKIVQYLPFKAAAMENWGLDFLDMLRISDWDAVQAVWRRSFDKWQKAYDSRISPLLSRLLTESGSRGARLLDLNPEMGDQVVIAAQNGFQVDGAASNRRSFAYILQRLQDLRLKGVRLRGDVLYDSLPFETGRYIERQGRTVGYDAALATGLPAQTVPQELAALLSEAIRVTKPEAWIVIGISGDYDISFLVAAAEDRGLRVAQEERELDGVGGCRYTLLLQKRKVADGLDEEVDIRIAYG